MPKAEAKPGKTLLSPADHTLILPVRGCGEAGRVHGNVMVDSWTEHMRQHQRVTEADRALQEQVNRFNRDGAPKVTHYMTVGKS